MKTALVLPTILLLTATQLASAGSSTLSFDFIQDLGDRDANGQQDKTYTADTDKGFRIRWGLNAPQSNRFEVAIATYSVNKAGRLSTDREDEIDANYIFMLNPSRYRPFVKLGAGFGKTKIGSEFTTSNGNKTNTLKNIHLNLGGGLSYPIEENISLTGTMDFVFRKWQDAEYTTETISISDKVFRFGVGMDFRFD